MVKRMIYSCVFLLLMSVWLTVVLEIEMSFGELLITLLILSGYGSLCTSIGERMNK